MAKIRLTKSELKKQKENLKRFVQYLPTLQLKKQQLQSEINKRLNELEEEKNRLSNVLGDIYEWVSVFAEDVKFEELMRRTEVHTEVDNIAGVDIPVFVSTGVKGEEYDLLKIPIWVDGAISAVEEVLSFKIKIKILEKQLEIINEELRITTQRVNLFEKVKIPESKENIRRIRIFIGDMQTAEVVRGKIAKEKINKKAALAA